MLNSRRMQFYRPADNVSMQQRLPRSPNRAHKGTMLNQVEVMRRSFEDVLPDIPVPDYDNNDWCVADFRRYDDDDGDDDAINNNNHDDTIQSYKQSLIDELKTMTELKERQNREPSPDYQRRCLPEYPSSPPASPHSPDSVSSLGVGRSAMDDNHDVLISPKKLRNPCLESKERQNLHRELLINNKIGRDVLKKSELQKKLEERECSRKKKEWEEYKRAKRTSLELMLEQRRDKYQQDEDTLKSISETDPASQPEYLKIHAKVTAAKVTAAKTP